MDFLFDLSNMSQEEEFTDSKEDILKFLKVIGVDTRFVSYTPSKLYINNLRFSKFSRTREKTFYKHYPDIKVIRSSLFMKILFCFLNKIKGLGIRDPVNVFYYTVITRGKASKLCF